MSGTFAFHQHGAPEHYGPTYGQDQSYAHGHGAYLQSLQRSRSHVRGYAQEYPHTQYHRHSPASAPENYALATPMTATPSLESVQSTDDKRSQGHGKAHGYGEIGQGHHASDAGAQRLGASALRMVSAQGHGQGPYAYAYAKRGASHSSASTTPTGRVVSNGSGSGGSSARSGMPTWNTGGAAGEGGERRGSDASEMEKSDVGDGGGGGMGEEEGEDGEEVL